MIHRFVDLQQEADAIAFVMWMSIAASFEFYAGLWKVSSDPGQDVAEVSTSYHVTTDTSDTLADPSVSPDGTRVAVCTMLGGTPQVSRVHCGLVDGSNKLQVGSDNPSTLFLSLQPWWHPDSSQLIYRHVDNSPNESYIKRSDIASDGSSSGETTLLTKNRSTQGTISFPTYTYDGTKIVYLLLNGGTTTLRACNADGSGDALLASPAHLTVDIGKAFSVANTQNVVAYSKRSTGPERCEIRKVNVDGTGDTLLFTEDGTFDWGITRRAWSADDSEILMFHEVGGAAPIFRLWTIDPGGSGGAAVATSQSSYGLQNDQLAFVYGQRVYWVYGNDSTGDDNQLVSCLTDGGGYRVELDATNTISPYDNLQLVSMFMGRDNQPE